MFTNISDQFDDITLSLCEDDTAWNHSWLVEKYKINIPFVTDAYKRNYNIIIIVRMIIAFVSAFVINFYHNNALVYIIFTPIWVISTLVNIYDANYSVFLDALTTFDVYYKLVNICIGYSCLEFAIRDDYHEQISSSSTLTILIIICRIVSVIGNLGVVFLISLFDGFSINYKLKLSFGIIAVGFYTFQITQIYLTSSTTSSSTLFGMNIDWRVVGISTFISTNFFIIKQYVRTGILGIASSTILCHIPIQKETIESTPSFFNNSGRGARGIVKNSTNLEMSQLNVNLLEFEHENENENIINININGYKATREERIINFESQSIEHLNLRASQIIRDICDKLGYNISIRSDITLFYMIFTKIFKLNESKSWHLSQKLARKKMLLGSIFGIIIYIIIYIITQKYYQEILNDNYNLTMCWLGIIITTASTFVLFFLFFNLNYQIVLYKIKTFQTWWILFDVFLMQTSITLINKRSKKYVWIDNYKDYQLWTSYYREVLFYFHVVFLIPLCVTMVQGIIGTYSKISKIWINIAIICAIVFWLSWGIEYLLDDNDDTIVVIFGNDIRYGLSLNHIVFIKATDAAIWFMIQLYRQNKYPNMIVWQKIQCKWILDQYKS